MRGASSNSTWMGSLGDLQHLWAFLTKARSPMPMIYNTKLCGIDCSFNDADWRDIRDAIPPIPL